MLHAVRVSAQRSYKSLGIQAGQDPGVQLFPLPVPLSSALLCLGFLIRWTASARWVKWILATPDFEELLSSRSKRHFLSKCPYKFLTLDLPSLGYLPNPELSVLSRRMESSDWLPFCSGWTKRINVHQSNQQIFLKERKKEWMNLGSQWFKYISPLLRDKPTFFSCIPRAECHLTNDPSWEARYGLQF